MSHSSGISNAIPQHSLIAAINKNDARGLKAKKSKKVVSTAENNLDNESSKLRSLLKEKASTFGQAAANTAKGKILNTVA
ncbi:MAG: hypothetical protein ACP59X_16195 [Solidesulfovibrio sp. DCME]|uniref:hypothetical protein n=1 Tax=Solidesulfovibrio sp. DCME TaxID=3447380 RepID=UPI003D13D383